MGGYEVARRGQAGGDEGRSLGAGPVEAGASSGSLVQQGPCCDGAVA